MSAHEEERSVSPILLQEAIDILTTYFSSEVQVKSVVRLSNPERRNLIARITLASLSNNVPEHVIFKQSHAEKSSEDAKEVLGRFARDWAGLEFLSDLHTEIPVSPRFYGGSQQHRFVLLEDLGETHISLVDSLTAHDRDAAIAALTRYMQRMGQFHASSYGRTAHYTALLEKLNPNAETWLYDCNDMFSNVAGLLEKLGLQTNEAIHSEMQCVLKTIKEPGHFTTVIHGDICPDNVFDDPPNNSMHIIDYEWGFVGNALLDGTYLRMSMPTCWCAKALPNDVIESLEKIYRTELIHIIPAATNDTYYYEAYVAACAYWMLVLLSSGIAPVLDKDYDISNPQWHNLHPNWKPEDNRRWPRILSRLQAFIDVASKHQQLPHLQAMAEQVLKKLAIRWPEAKPLALFPVFMEEYDESK